MTCEKCFEQSSFFPKKEIICKQCGQKFIKKPERRKCEKCGWKTLPLPHKQNLCSGCGEKYSEIKEPIQEIEEKMFWEES